MCKNEKILKTCCTDPGCDDFILRLNGSTYQCRGCAFHVRYTGANGQHAPVEYKHPERR